jgi:quercetin dioxygenase-like cupin family protein
MKAEEVIIEEQAPGPLVRKLVAGSATDNRLALLEIHGSAGGGIVRHVHEHEDEVVYVLEGELTFHLGDEVHQAREGSCLVLPRGIEHSYVVESGPARLLVAVTPAGLEGLLEEVTRIDRADIERLITVAARYGITITGPAPESASTATTGYGPQARRR